jgi:mono/diheme cytochrome c family protein
MIELRGIGYRPLAAALAMSLGAVAAAAEPGDVARGKYLATIGICASCHTPSDSKGEKIQAMKFAGGQRTGGILSANLTSDPQTGLGNWTEDQIVEAIRNGHRPDGSPVRPPMGVFFYRGLSDRDAHAIAAYLKTLPPINNKIERLPAKLVPTYPVVTSVPEPDHSNQLAYGHYLTQTVSHCLQCHTPRLDGLPDLARAGAGGNSYEVPGGGVVVAANITPGDPDGIVKWTDAQLKTAITTGVRPDGSRLVPLMDFDMYAEMKPEDLDALVAYVRTLKPIAPSGN